MMFLILCVIIEETYDGVNYAEVQEPYAANRFLVVNNLYNADIYTTAIAVFYFSQTTVTTIGLGDLAPKGEAEAIFIVIIFLFAVCI
jgi:hypothetical protein